MPRPFQVLSIPKFLGEVDTQPSTDIEDPSADLIQNLYMVNNGLERRLGQKLINTVQADGFIIQGLSWCRVPLNNPTEYVVGAKLGNLYDFYNGGTVAAPTLLANGSGRLLIDGTPVDMAVVDGKLYIADGTNPLVRFNGTNVAKSGSSPPTTAVTFNAFVGGGVLTGNVQYYCTYLDADGHESEPSPASAVIAPSGQNVTVNLPNDTDTDRSGKNLYRLGVSGTVYKKVNTTAIGASATTYTDSVTDANLGAQIVLGNTLMPSCQHLWEHDSRLFGCGNAADPHTLYISNQFAPWYCPASPNTLDPTQGLRLQIQGRHAKIIGGCSHGGYVFIFTDEGGYILQGTTQDDYRLDRFTNHGCASHRSIQSIRNWLFWVGPDGIYRYGGYEGAYSGISGYDALGVTRIDKPILQWFSLLSSSNLSNAVSWVYQDRYYLAFPSDGSGGGIYAGAQPGHPGGGIASINPNTLTNWQVIADARTITGHTDGQSLTAWNDSSGNNRNGVGAATYRLSSGTPWVDFYNPGVGTGMNFSVGQAPIDCTNGFSLYAIYRQESLTSSSGGLGFEDSFLARFSATHGFALYAQGFNPDTNGSTTSAVQLNCENSIAIPNPTKQTLPFVSPYLVYVSVIASPPQSGAGTIRLYVNGKLVAVTTNWFLAPSDTLSGTGNEIGNSADASNRQLKAKVGWYGWANTAHSESTRIGIEKYLTSIWT